MIFTLHTFISDKEYGYFDYCHCSPLGYEKCPDEELPEELTILFAMQDAYHGITDFGYMLSDYSRYGKHAFDSIYGRKNFKEKKS